ncbi:MAG TPA: GMC family oxidoreductase [Bryobacteraceae bacterium]|nr:GMC family oxidoreductase [Bryobacteraceae bacterium]
MATKKYDVIVVGSGASGGWASKVLAESGLQVLVVDCGRPQKDSNFTEHVPVFDLKYRNLKFHEPVSPIIRQTRPVQGQCYACTEWNYEWFANDHDEPYTTAPGMDYSYFGRLRVVGGRTNVWGRLCYRLSDLDFKAASHDGYGEDWPISYKDVAPYYDRVERYVGITGMREGMDVLPDGHYQPPMGLTCAEWRLRDSVKQKFGRTVTQGRSANITQALNGRQPCHYCGPCERGCVTHSYFNSSYTTLKDALATGKCDLVVNAMVYKVLMDPATNRATGVLYIDRVTKQPREVHARVVILGAAALESTRILLNSKTSQYSNGLANSSGVLGHYYTDSLKGGLAAGTVPGGISQLSINSPHRPTGVYIMRFRNVPGSPKMKDFRRGYGMQGSSGSGFHASAPGFGEAYMRAAKEPVETFNLQCYGEPLPRFENYVELDPKVLDAFGIPVLRMHVAWGDEERSMMKDASEQAAEMLEAAGVKDIKVQSQIHLPGDANHDVGTARMGNDPKKSVLNKFQQTHDVKNLFVMDGSCFNSPGCQNPTLTIMSLAVRASDYLKEELRKGNI